MNKEIKKFVIKTAANMGIRCDLNIDSEIYEIYGEGCLNIHIKAVPQIKFHFEKESPFVKETGNILGTVRTMGADCDTIEVFVKSNNHLQEKGYKIKDVITHEFRHVWQKLSGLWIRSHANLEYINRPEERDARHFQKLTSLTCVKLKKWCKLKKITGYSRLNKRELIDVLMAVYHSRHNDEEYEKAITSDEVRKQYLLEELRKLETRLNEIETI
jgi:hypothetical protein